MRTEVKAKHQKGLCAQIMVREVFLTRLEGKRVNTGLALRICTICVLG